ncbi:coiled-coil domain-containing protein 57 [Bombina bombina]|uniref:coiled-coil domain-containing protein 57 n=1 Tax=Bombina bombina TaxID=8345 RepID=UPI00235A7C35|nr:coiled-coil domain-containing protein 57 [Bombina bombina]
MFPPEEGFTELLAKKEQEFKELQHRHVQSLEIALKDMQTNLQDQQEKFNRLKKDFTYNLRVLGERDQELEQFEVMFSRLKVVENAKQSEISDLKIQIEKLQQEILRECKKHDELQTFYQQKLREHQIDMKRLQRSKNKDIDHHCAEYEKVKRQLERKIEEVEGDLALQKQEMMLEFDSEMKKREHEFRLHLDETSTLVMSHELKVKILTKELDIVKEASLKSSEALQEAESTNLKLQEEIQKKDWELNDLKAVKDARIKHLEEKFTSLQRKRKIEEDSFQRKHEQLDRSVREKESAIRSMKEAHSEKMQHMEKQIQQLQLEQHRSQRSYQDILAQKDATIEKQKEDLDVLKTGWDSYIAQISKETVTKDLKTQALQEEEERLKAQLDTYKKDIEKYKQQLSCSLERERLLEQSKVQLELDWQKRCEEAEKAQYQHSEDLIERLNKSKEQAVAELKEKDRKLNELETLVSAITRERDQAMDAVLKHGAKLPQIAEDNGGFQNHFPSQEIQHLQEQNTELRHVIGQMRKEMELLCDQITNPVPNQPENPKMNPQNNHNNSDYIQSLEEEVKNLKQKNRLLEEQLQPAQSLTNLQSTSSIHGLRESTGVSKAAHIPSFVASQKLEAKQEHAGMNPVNILQLHEEILLLRQELSLFKALGSVSSGAHVPILLSKLKQAARKISQLSLEKQQLIDLGNRLRAELASVEVSLPQKSVQLVSSTLSSKMEVQEAQNRLSALEDLQYQLTCQELQYAQYHPSSIRLAKGYHSFNTKNKVDHEDAGTAKLQTLMSPSPVNDWKKERKENTPPLLSPHAHSTDSVRSLPPTSSWLQHDTSLQDVWKLLDMGSSPSLISSLEDSEQVILARKRREDPSVKTGSLLLTHQKESHKPVTRKQIKPKSSQNTPKIRNYNFRD